jgi:carbon storage regulator
MLVISRKPGERICLGDEITITVMEVSGSTVRIGIEAPPEVPIYRHEIWAAIKEENVAAAQADVERLPAPEERVRRDSSNT